MYNNQLFEQIARTSNIDDAQKILRQDKLHKLDDYVYPTWRRARIKDTSLPSYQAYNNQKVLWHKQSGLSVQPIGSYAGDIEKRLSDKKYGISEVHKTITEVFSNTGTFISVQPNVIASDPITIQLELTKENSLILDHHVIHAGAMSEVTVIIDYSDVSDGGYTNGVIHIVADDGAKVRVVKVQNLSKNSVHMHSAISIVSRESEVYYNSIDLGSGVTVTDYSTYLEDENATSHVQSAYLGDGTAKLDLGYNIYHNGRRSESDISVRGALLDEARKVFRGNLNFARGARRSHGSEEEFVILLDKRVQSDSIPALMCDEDDVQGEHAASAGQIDENKLFYLMSRGLSEKEAKQIIVMGSFEPVIEAIPVAGLKERVSKEVTVRLTKDIH